MHLNLRNKLLMLFLSDENPLWARLKAITRTLDRTHGLPKAKHDWLDVCGETVRQWKIASKEAAAGAVDGIAHFVGRLEHLQSLMVRADDRTEVQALRKAIEAFLAHYSSTKRMEVYDVGVLLKMSDTDVQRALDHAIYRERPLLRSPYYEGSAEGLKLATTHFNALRGIYHVLMRRGDNWMRCPMRVRDLFPMPLHKRVLYVIRTKLHCPILDPDHDDITDAQRHRLNRPYWSYDGFVSVMGPRIFWTFEKRSGLREDFIQAATGHGRSIENQRMLAGKYLTTDQDPEQSIVADRVLLKRLYVPEDEPVVHDEQTDIMWPGAAVIEPGAPEYEEVERLYRLTA